MTPVRSEILSGAARGAAKKLLEELNIQDPAEIDVELIATHCGAHVVYQDLLNEEGRLLRTRGGSPAVGLIVVDRQARDSEKWRFVVAHEIGHLIRHVDLDQMELCTNTDLSDWYGGSGHEAEANYFASELLMPESLFKPLCDRKQPSLKDVRELAERFTTSLTATAIRFVQFCPEPCAVVHSSDGAVDWFHKSDDFALFLYGPGHELGRDTYAGDLFAGEDVEDRPQFVDGSAWSDNYRAENFDLKEHSVQLGRYGSVLTFLWHAYD